MANHPAAEADSHPTTTDGHPRTAGYQVDPSFDHRHAILAERVR